MLWPTGFEFRKIIIIANLFLLFSKSVMAGDGPPPPPFDAPKSQQAFAEHLTLAEKGQAYSQYVVCLAYYDGRVIKERNVDAALSWCTLAANQGLAKAQYYLGYFYLNGLRGPGQVIERDTEKAVYWFQLAANQGSSAAQNRLGELYEARRDHTKAIQWYQLAGATKAIEDIHKRYAQFEEYVRLANTGDAQAQFKVFFGCIDGFINNGKSDYRESVYGNLDAHLIKEYCTDPLALGISAANQGLSQAQFYLGRYYLHGNSVVEKDIEQALYWFRLNTQYQDHGGTEDYVGDAYKNGDGVEKDIDQAIYWYELAAKKGNPYARTKLRKIREPQ